MKFKRPRRFNRDRPTQTSFYLTVFFKICLMFDSIYFKAQLMLCHIFILFFIYVYIYIYKYFFFLACLFLFYRFAPARLGITYFGVLFPL